MVFTLDVNYLAVFVVALIGFFIGFLWYGPVFGKQWIKAMKMNPKEVEKNKQKGMSGMMAPMFISFITALLTSFVLAVLLKSTNTIGVLDGVMLGVFVWAGFFLATNVSGMLWEGKGASLFTINTTYDLFRAIVMSVILSVWV